MVVPKDTISLLDEGRGSSINTTPSVLQGQLVCRFVCACPCVFTYSPFVYSLFAFISVMPSNSLHVSVQACLPVCVPTCIFSCSCVCVPPPGPRHPRGHGLRSSAPPLGGVPGAPAAVRGLETSLGHQGDQHRGVPAPQACPLPPRLHPQRHHGEDMWTHTYTHLHTYTQLHWSQMAER